MWTVKAAAELLQQGDLVAFPTETVYGLGADACNARAVAKIYATKQRPSFNPLIAHCTDLAMAEKFGMFGLTAKKLAEHFWPGPLSLVVPLRPDSDIRELVTAGLDTIALRVPNHPIAQQLIAEFGGPLAAPSANLSGRLSPTQASHVRANFGEDLPILDGGPTRDGVESTILACLDNQLMLLRPGAVTAEQIEQVTGQQLTSHKIDEKAPLAPGMLLSHYAPNAKIRLEATSVEPGEALLAFGPDPIEGAAHVLNLSPTGDLIEAAANLFAHLHKLDATGATSIAVMNIPDHGLGIAINDRLSRAAAPRD